MLDSRPPRLRATACIVALSAAAASARAVFAHADSPPHPRAAARHIDQIESLLHDGRFEDARMETIIQLNAQPDDGVLLYLFARASAQVGEYEQADQSLLEAIRAGFQDFSRIRREPDLDPLRSRPMLQAILAARDAADDALAERRIDDWLTQPSLDQPTWKRDDQRSLDWVLPRDADGPIGEMIRRANLMFDALTDTLFVERVNWRTMIVVGASDSPSPTQGAVAVHHIRGGYNHARLTLTVDELRRALPHELVHVLHHRSMDALGQAHAFWIQEGLGCLYETFEESADGCVVVANNERDDIVRSMVKQDLAIDWLTFCSGSREAFLESPASTYAQARSMMRFIDEEVGIRTWYDEYAASFKEDSTGVIALVRAFDQPLDVIEQRWREWVRSRDVVIRPGTLAEVRLLRVAPAIVERDVSERTSADADSEVNSTYESLRPVVLGDYASAIPSLCDLIDAEPNHARARYDLALAYIHAGQFDEASAQLTALQPLDRNLASLVQSLLSRR